MPAAALITAYEALEERRRRQDRPRLLSEAKYFVHVLTKAQQEGWYERGAA
jgi:hypothetical protein